MTQYLASGPYAGYALSDFNTIIDAYAYPGAGADLASDYIYPGIMDDLKNASGWASIERSLQEHLDNAKSNVEEFYTYTDKQREATGEVAGLEFQNTWTRIGASDNAGEVMKAVVADCVPCKERVIALLSLNPAQELWDRLDQMYAMEVSFLNELFDLLLGNKSMMVFADFCQLIDFLNFMCVPDLYRMVLVLAALIQKYTIDLAAVHMGLVDILGKLFGTSLTPLLSLLDKYIQLIVGPIDCVIDEINHNLQKLDIMKAAEVINNERAKDHMPQIDDDLKDTIRSPLIMLRKNLKDARDAVDKKFDEWNREVKEFLGAKDEADKQLFSYTFKIEQITRLVALIQAMIIAATHGVVCQKEDEIESFLNTYLKPLTDINMIVKDGIVQISPKLPEGMGEVLADIGAGPKDLPKVASVEIPLRTCFTKTSSSELKKIRKYLSTFKG